MEDITVNIFEFFLLGVRNDFPLKIVGGEFGMFENIWGHMKKEWKDCRDSEKF